MADVTSKDILVLERKDPRLSDNGSFKTQGHVLRVVEWGFTTSKGEAKTSRKLEKRKLFLGEDGTINNGKAEGFSVSDLQMVMKSWDDIMLALTGKTPEPKTEDQEVPF